MIRRLVATLAVVLAAGAPAGPAVAEVAAEKIRQDALYAALCRGIVWPDDRPTLLAADTLPAVAALELTVRAGLDALAAADPALAPALAREAADGSAWLDAALAAGATEQVAQVRGECLVHLETLAPTLSADQS